MSGATIMFHVRRPPSANALWARAGGGGRKRSAAYSAWLRDAGWEVKMQTVGIPPLDCRFDVDILVPISRRDSDNWTKPLLDLCEHIGLVTNDGNMHRVTITPVERDDCALALTPLPGMDGVRQPAKRGYAGRVIPGKPDQKRLAKIAEIRGRIPF